MRRACLVLVVLAVGAPASAAPAATPRGALDVRQRTDVSGGTYIEGSTSYLRVLRRGRTVARASVTARLNLRLRVRLQPGRYRLVSFQRPCQGNCGFLDPRADRCSRRLRVFAAERTEARVVTRPFRGCRIGLSEPSAFPSRRRIAAARRFVAARALSAFALIDTHGRTWGFASRRRYITASVVKAMLLVAYLRQIGNRVPDAAERAALGPMITVSDNGRANQIYGRVGDSGLLGVARAARMTDLSVAGYWGNVSFSARDQARFFWRFDALVPPRSRPYARRLLASIVGYQRWGFSPPAARAGWRTYFKGGWRGTARGSLVHEAARFERGGRRFALAVLSDANPSHGYGTATLRGVARRLFARRAR